MTVSIVGVDSHPRLTELLESWFLSEWGDVDPLIDPRASYPPPLFALDADGELVGGLSFTESERSEAAGPAVWINAVFVQPEMRRKGIASQLIEHAEAAAADGGIPKLYAYTEAPGLYTKRGWTVVTPKGPSAVLSKTVVK